MPEQGTISDGEIMFVACDAMTELEFFRQNKGSELRAVEKICSLLHDFKERSFSDPVLCQVFHKTLEKFTAELIGIKFESIKTTDDLRSAIDRIYFELSFILLQPLAGIPENIELLRDFCMELSKTAAGYFPRGQRKLVFSA